MIFNLGAIVVGVITLLIGAGFQYLAMPYLSMPTMNFISLHILLAVSFIVEVLGLKPRLFFIPTWIISFVLIGTDGYEKYGPVSIVYTVLLIGLVIWGILKLVKRIDEKSLNKRIEYLNYFKENVSTLSEDDKVGYLAHSFSPESSKSTEFMHHNKDVLELILDNYHSRFSVDNIELIKKQILNYENMLNGVKVKRFHNSHEDTAELVSTVLL